MKKEGVREWINTVINLLVLLVMVYGVFVINSINVNLKNITAEKGNFGEITSVNANLTNATVGSIRLIKIPEQCDLTVNGSICSNTTGTYIVG